MVSLKNPCLKIFRRLLGGFKGSMFENVLMILRKFKGFMFENFLMALGDNYKNI
jgi:hypothetical protein